MPQIVVKWFQTSPGKEPMGGEFTFEHEQPSHELSLDQLGELCEQEVDKRIAAGDCHNPTW